VGLGAGTTSGVLGGGVAVAIAVGVGAADGVVVVVVVASLGVFGFGGAERGRAAAALVLGGATGSAGALADVAAAEVTGASWRSWLASEADGVGDMDVATDGEGVVADVTVADAFALTSTGGFVRPTLQSTATTTIAPSAAPRT